MTPNLEVAAPRTSSPEVGSYIRVPKEQGQGAKDDLFLFVVNSAEMVAAGLTKLVAKSVRLGGRQSHLDTVSKELRNSLAHLHLAKIDVAGPGHTLRNIHDDMQRMSAMLDAIRLIPEEQLISVVEQLESVVTSAASGADGLYQVLTAEELAGVMKCSKPLIYQREASGEFFSALAPGRKNGKLFPAFLVNEKLDQALMTRVIGAYREAEVSTTLLWSFMRSPQNEFAGKTPVEMLLGASAPAYADMTREQRAEAIMDVFEEHISRVR